MHPTNTACGIKVCEVSPPKIKLIQHLSVGIYGSHGQLKSNPATGVQNSISVTRQQQTLNDNSTTKVLMKVDTSKTGKDTSPTSNGTQCQWNKQKIDDSFELNLQNSSKQQSKTGQCNKTMSAVRCDWEMQAHNVATMTEENNADVRPTVPFKQQSFKERCFDNSYDTFKSTGYSHRLKNYHSCSRMNLKRIATAMEEYRLRLQSANILPNLQNIHALAKTNCKVINLDEIKSNDLKRNSNACLKSTNEIPIQLTTALDGSMLYCCSECIMAYSSKELLEEHFVVHKEARRNKCDDCGVSLKPKENLEQHKQAHGPPKAHGPPQAHGPTRPFVCDVCRKAFKRNEHLKRHVVTHSGAKSHGCARCGKAFSRKDHLIKHLVTHRRKDPTGSDFKKNLR